LTVARGVQGYICTPHEKESNNLVEKLSSYINITNIYFVTATFSSESMLYFPNRANHYILASFSDSIDLELIYTKIPERLSFVFKLSDSLFERSSPNIKYMSIYFTRYVYGELEISDIANIIARREKVRNLTLAQLQFLNSSHPKFVFPYARNVIMLEVEGEKTHQSDQKYCERTQRDVARKGLQLINLVSLSILDKLK
jgi:hypothetical protein